MFCFQPRVKSCTESLLDVFQSCSDFKYANTLLGLLADSNIAFPDEKDDADLL